MKRGITVAGAKLLVFGNLQKILRENKSFAFLQRLVNPDVTLRARIMRLKSVAA
ncbi:MAG: hypothetical protein J6B52_04210 [Clostridia bacterium]|nr:hypothetical protein [Clostridia bacterium]